MQQRTDPKLFIRNIVLFRSEATHDRRRCNTEIGTV